MKTLARFGIVGLANTATSALVIFLLLRAGLGDYGANFVGYAVGLCLSFVLNRNWTFGVQGRVRLHEVVRFGAVVAVSYGINLLVLTAMRLAGYAESVVGQGAAMVSYSVCFFLLSRRFAFRHAAPESKRA